MASDIVTEEVSEDRELDVESAFTPLEKNKFKCTLCEKVVHRHHLSSHLHSHTGYKCAVCGKEYTRKSSLTKHMKTRDHMKRKVFQCELCDKSFSRKCTLDIHLQLHKLYEGAFVCKVCGKEFSQELHLLDHVNKERHHLQAEVTPIEPVEQPREVVNNVDSTDAAKVFHLPFQNEMVPAAIEENELTKPSYVTASDSHKVSLLPLPNALLAISTSPSELSRPYSFKNSDLHKTLVPSDTYDATNNSNDSDLSRINTYNHSDLLKLSSSLTSSNSFGIPQTNEASNVYVTSTSHNKTQSSWTSSAYDKQFVEKLDYESPPTYGISEPRLLEEHGKHLLFQQEHQPQMLLKAVVPNDRDEGAKQIIYEIPTVGKQSQYTTIHEREDVSNSNKNIVYEDLQHLKLPSMHESQLLLKTVDQASNVTNVPKTLLYSGIPTVNTLTSVQDSPQMILIPISRDQLSDTHLMDKRIIYEEAPSTPQYVTATGVPTVSDIYQGTTTRQQYEVKDDDAAEKQQILRNMLLSNMVGSVQYTTTCQPLPGQTVVFDIGGVNGLDLSEYRYADKETKTIGRVAVSEASEMYSDTVQDIRASVTDDAVNITSDNNSSPPQSIAVGVDKADMPKIPQTKYFAHMKKLNIASLQKGDMQDAPPESERLDKEIPILQPIDVTSEGLKQQQTTFVYDYVPRHITEDGTKGVVVYVDQSAYIARSEHNVVPEEVSNVQLEATEPMGAMSAVPQAKEVPERRDSVETPNTESTYSSSHSYPESTFNDAPVSTENHVAENGLAIVAHSENVTVAEAVPEEKMTRKRPKKGGSSSSKRSKSDSGYKSYKCSSCDRHFPCSSALERHRLNKHPPHVVCHTCSICGKALYHPSHVYIHMRTHV